jgi:hypothetical protein
VHGQCGGMSMGSTGGAGAKVRAEHTGFAEEEKGFASSFSLASEGIRD